MSAIWILPSLAMGLYLGFANGMWQLAMMSVASSLVAVLMASRQRSQNAAKAPAKVSLHPRRKVLQIDGKKITQVRWWLSSTTRKSVRQAVVELVGARSNQQALARILAEGCATEPSFLCPLYLGASEGRQLQLDLAAAPHIFVVGPTGCGKTQLLRQLIRGLLNSPPHKQIDVAIIDFKGGAIWVGLSGVDNAWMLASDLDLADCWVRLTAELASREASLAKAKVTRFDEANLKPLAVFLDELGEAVKTPAAAAALASIGARGRSLGIFLVASNQGISGVPRELLLNLRTRILLAGVDQVELVQLGGKARELVSPDSSILSARLIRQGQAETDFVFRSEFALSQNLSQALAR